MTKSAMTVARRIQLTRRLTGVARKHVLEGGLDSFTLEDLAAEVGVSRRTFFNYFASKEHAVLGVSMHAGSFRGEAVFVARATNNHAGLFDDLAELTIARLESYIRSADELADLLLVIQKAPRLQRRLLQLMRQQADQDVSLVERREGLAHGDPRARLAVDVINLLLEHVIAERLAGQRTLSFRHHFGERLAAVRAVMAPALRGAE